MDIDQPTFKIGVVSRLTGVPAETLRMWERRYRVVEPLRGKDRGSRLYTRTHILRLTLIKQLVDQGNAISTVANLAEPELRNRLKLHKEIPLSPDKTVSRRNTRIALLGETLPLLVESSLAELEGLDVAGAFTSRADFDHKAADAHPDVLVLEYPSLHLDMVDQTNSLMQQCGARHVVIVYVYGAKEALRRLQSRGITLLRAPVTMEDLRTVCLRGTQSTAVVDFDLAGEVPAPMFDQKILATLANITTSIKCECPHHLTDLIYRLTAFENYSQQCENRNDKDAALHAYLHRSTARARSIIETALQRLVEVEGFKLPEY